MLDTIDITNVGKGYKEPKIYVSPEEIGDISVDTQGRLLTPSITTKTIGFIKPRIVDPEGFGARIVPTYQYVGPSKFNEIFESQSYTLCGTSNMPVAREVEQASGVSDP